MPQRPKVAKFHTGSTQLSPNPMVSDLNLNNQQCYTMARKDYRDDLRDKETIYERLKALRAILEPSDKQLKQSARTAYDRARKWSSKMKQDQWITAYRNAYIDAKLVYLLNVTEYQPHYDFVSAISDVNPGCAAAIQSILVQHEQTDEDPPDFLTSCLEFFENWQQSQLA
ncbi:uncharacterized protein BDR25DRAFT_320679 [Lindgomyces ingoldianus]|uniref:Uncharacterized protein n=1 Tax=Lindgomyces ingoldianus TaxID=673940 RepID=A0ACB6Q7I0_9PLEO|nr:uncharacterized protein BDR25DRAFT_320679 [Lindgomyces ingoldianus]KAF2462505.1 hypothetical protein BDR25DRAFT_320679 [Lindgomyces ingoldianus]